MSLVAEIQDRQAYAELLSETLPHVIRTEAENERYLATVARILAKPDKTQEENRLAELLVLLIEDFEERNYRMPVQATPLDVVKHLMEGNRLRQSDILDVFGSASVASAVLNGKRGLSKTHIERLSRRFRVSPEVFFG